MEAGTEHVGREETRETSPDDGRPSLNLPNIHNNKRKSTLPSLNFIMQNCKGGGRHFTHQTIATPLAASNTRNHHTPPPNHPADADDDDEHRHNIYFAHLRMWRNHSVCVYVHDSGHVCVCNLHTPRFLMHTE